MAKQKINTQKTPSSERIAKINQLLSRAEDESASPPVFANQVQIAIAPEEVTIDFYRSGPKRGHVSSDPHVAFVQRIIMPPSAAARFAEVFADLFKATHPDDTNTETHE